ncbi:choice-of-anchor I family protein [Lysobacter korlensis]|uniref:Choice-of-anchor I family protein n=1 Tax=Lysobacter korlensis TaxID=553636 RepID=A0ABV6RNV1_9GAMM
MTPSRPTPGGAAARLAAGALAVAVPFSFALPASTAAVVDEPISYSAPGAALALSPLGSYDTGQFDESAAEIVAYFDNRVFVVNAQAGSVDVLDISEPATPEKLYTLTSDGVANSVAIRDDGLGVIAVESETKTDPGSLVFFDARTPRAAAVLGTVQVGALPDMVTISEDGRYAVVANEGEPDDDYTVDPEGSVSVVALPKNLTAATQSAVRTADFHAFEDDGSTPLDEQVRIFAGIDGVDHPVSRNLEPEYIAVEGDTAYVTLQEANAVAEVSLQQAQVTDIWPLGFKDHSVEGAGIDPSDRDPRNAPTFDIRTYEGLFGVYMPDGISAYTARGATYLVTANEGDAREWGDYAEGERVADLEVCDSSPLAAYAGAGELGRLNVTRENGYNAEEECYDELYAFGARSFSIWTTDGTQVFDSGDSFERITHAALPEFFNSNHSESNLEGRSDDKGPEPESLTIGQIRGHVYAFIGFERVGGVAVYDITEPERTAFVTYLNNRDFSVSVEDAGDQDAALAVAGDLGPEGLTFIPAKDSPTREPLLAVANEVSGTTTLLSIDVQKRKQR